MDRHAASTEFRSSAPDTVPHRVHDEAIAASLGAVGVVTTYPAPENAGPPPTTGQALHKITLASTSLDNGRTWGLECRGTQEPLQPHADHTPCRMLRPPTGVAQVRPSDGLRCRDTLEPSARRIAKSSTSEHWRSDEPWTRPLQTSSARELPERH